MSTCTFSSWQASCKRGNALHPKRLSKAGCFPHCNPSLAREQSKVLGISSARWGHPTAPRAQLMDAPLHQTQAETTSPRPGGLMHPKNQHVSKTCTPPQAKQGLNPHHPFAGPMGVG